MKNLGSNRGFTLVEMLIATTVLSIGLLGMLRLHLLSIHSNHNGFLQTQASLLAVDILERMRVNGGQTRAGAYNIAMGAAAPAPAIDCEAADCTPAQLASFDRFQWRSRVAQLLPQGAASVVTNTAVTPPQVTVTVQWDDSRGQLPPTSITFLMSL